MPSLDDFRSGVIDTSTGEMDVDITKYNYKIVDPLAGTSIMSVIQDAKEYLAVAHWRHNAIVFNFNEVKLLIRSADIAEEHVSNLYKAALNRRYQEYLDSLKEKQQRNVKNNA
jgi:hypothetical protein